MCGLKVKGLSVAYDGLKVIDNIDLSISSREVVAILGPSGCGKTTLLKALHGLVPLAGGTVDKSAGCSIGMMFQASALEPWLTATEIVSRPAKIQGRKIDALPLLQRVGLGEYSGVYPWKLSGGMQRRLAFARLIATRPRILLLDEPFYALDEVTAERLYQEFARISTEDELTTVLVTHSITEALRLADRVVVLSNRPSRIVVDLRVPGCALRPLTMLGESWFRDALGTIRGAFGVQVES